MDADGARSAKRLDVARPPIPQPRTTTLSLDDKFSDQRLGIGKAITLCGGWDEDFDCRLRSKGTCLRFEEVDFSLGCRFYRVVSAVPDYPEEAELFPRFLVAEVAQPY